MSVQICLSWLLEVKPGSDRVGPLAVVGLINDSMQPAGQKLPPILPHQVCLLFDLVSFLDVANIRHLAAAKDVLSNN